MNLVSRYMQGYIQKVCRGGGGGAQHYKNLRRGGGENDCPPPPLLLYCIYMIVKIECLVIPVIQKYLNSKVSRCEEGPPVHAIR